MSDKALEFEDFILDDYDFNLLTDWDLMDLWEWVEMDDFSDIVERDQKTMTKKVNSSPHPPYTPQQSQQKQQLPPQQPSYQQQASTHSSTPSQNISTAPSSQDDNDNDFDDNDFDFDFDFEADEDNIDPASPASSSPITQSTPLPSPTKHIASSLPPAPPSPASPPINDTPKDLSSAPHIANDDDFDFDFNFDDDENTEFNFDNDIPSVNSQKTPSSMPIPATQTHSSSTAPATQTHSSSPSARIQTPPKTSASHLQSNSPLPVTQNYQKIENKEEDDNFDFSFDDDDADSSEEDSEDNDNFDFNFDDDDADNTEEDSEDNDNFDFSFDDDDDNESEETDYDFDFTDENAQGIGSGGFQKKVPQEPHENRFIQTSVGVLDTHNDDILERLQELDFDEFLKVLQENPHVYDKILTTGNWSEEEMEFLHSIEPLVRDSKKIQQARDKKSEASPSSASPSASQKPRSGFDTRIYQNAEDMYKQLCLKASELASQKGQQQKVKHLPDNLAQQWNKDSEEKQAHRVSHHLGTTLKVAPKPPPPPLQELTPPQGITARPLPYLGVNEAKFNEINHIFLHELYAMSQTLTPEALNYVRADGVRFGTEFVTFLMNKYGSKILFLYRTQMKNDILSHKIFASHLSYITAHLQPDNPEYYTMGFFKSIVDIIDKNGLNI